MSDNSIVQLRPHRLMRVVLRIALICRWFLIVLVLISVKRWFEGKHDGWRVLMDFAFSFGCFATLGMISKTYAFDETSPQAEAPS